MSEKTYPDETGYDPTVGMGKEVFRFEYYLWFDGDYIKARELGDVIENYLKAKGRKPIESQYGIMSVPEEDIGHLLDEP